MPSVISSGYRLGAIFNEKHLAHRVIWAMQTGKWPVGDIDHIDGDRLNNRWSNLRLVSHAVNGRNAVLKSSNTSGANGVSYRPDRGKWRARIMVDGREKSLGHFDSYREAVEARRAAQGRYGFTNRHGRERE
jgi:hypothetical protein